MNTKVNASMTKEDIIKWLEFNIKLYSNMRDDGKPGRLPVEYWNGKVRMAEELLYEIQQNNPVFPN